MGGYVLVEDILDEMTQNISYIKLKSYLKERKSWFLFFFSFIINASLPEITSCFLHIPLLIYSSNKKIKNHRNSLWHYYSGKLLLSNLDRIIHILSSTSVIGTSVDIRITEPIASPLLTIEVKV